LANFFKSSPLKPLGQMNRNLVGSIYDRNLMMFPTNFRFIWQSSFRGDDFLEINQSETKIICGGYVCLQIGTKWAIFIEDLPRVNFSHFNLLLWNPSAKWSETW
jgi:hypothetical protein